MEADGGIKRGYDETGDEDDERREARDDDRWMVKILLTIPQLSEIGNNAVCMKQRVC